MNIVKKDIIEEFCSPISFFEKGSTDAFYIYLTYNYIEKKVIFNLAFLSANESLEFEKAKEKISYKNSVKVFKAIDIKLNELYEKVCSYMCAEEIELIIDQMNYILSEYLFIRKKDNFPFYNEYYQRLKKEYSMYICYLSDNSNFNNFTLKDNDSVDKYRFRVFNVGQANCFAMYKDECDIPYAVFDFGCDEHENKEQVEMLNNLDSNGIIVVSHFHSDHINMYDEISDLGYKRLFIIPEVSKYMTTKKIRKFLEKLYANRTHVIQIRNDSLRDFLKYENIEIYQGTLSKMSKFQSSSMNTRCLVSVVTNKKDNVIIQADAFEEEYNIPYNVFTYGTVSHHGAFYSGVKKFNIQHAFLPVNTGSRNVYHHPQINHLSLYDNVMRFEPRKGKKAYVYHKNKKVDDVVTIKINDKFFKEFILY